MLARFLRRAGVDPVQWHALVVVGLKLDFHGRGVSSGVKRILASQAIYLMLGAALAATALFSPDVFVSATIGLTMTMFLVAASVLMEFAVVVISPLDYDVLGYQPISSSTYFAARLANVLFYTACTTTAVGLLPMAVYFFARGFNPLLGLTAIVAFYLASTTTTLAMIVAYVGLARLIHPQKLRRTLTYLQLFLSFAVYGGYLVMPSLFNIETMRRLTVQKAPWMLLYPPTWFASYLELAIGRWSPLEWLPAVAGLVAFVALLRVASGRLSLGYSEFLSRQAARSEGSQQRRSGRWTIGLGRRERRAVTLLLRAQFRHDQRFRLAVLSMVPLTVFYLFWGLRQGPMRDPFVFPRGENGGMFLYFALLMIPTMLMASVGRSDSYRAAWVWFVTPARRGALVLAAKNVTVRYLLLPYLVALALLLTWFYGNPFHAFLHVLVEALIANLFLLAVVAVRPELPFASAVVKGQASGKFFAAIMAGSVVLGSSGPLLARFIYPHPPLLASVIAVLAGAGLGGERWLRRHVDGVANEMEFAE